jgi:hypothetical protein
MKKIKKIKMFKKLKKTAYFLTGLSAIFLWSCEDIKDWHDPTDDVPPGTVSNVTVKNINGGAWLYYTLPSGDNDLLAVRAEYSFEEGEETRNVFSSAFNDSILIEGYANTNEHAVNLYVIDKSRNESAPVSVTVKPLTPPVELIRQTLRLYPTFGGIYSEWKNEHENNVAIAVYLKDSIGDFVLHETYYTNARNGNYTFRNMQNVEQDLHIEIRDKWDNYATPADTVITPLFEEEIHGRDPVTLANIWQRYGYDDKTCLYRGDVSTQANEAGREFWRIHDGIVFQNSTWWMTDSNPLTQFIDWPDNLYQAFPVYFTIDMGRKAAYSRLRYWMRSRSPYYSASAMASFELWGANEPKALNTIGDGSKEANLKYWTQWPEVEGTDEWKNDWVKLADCIIQFPSGANPYTTGSSSVLTQEDKDFIAAGFGFDIDPIHTGEPYRYLRFVVRSTNYVGAQLQITELKFWGAYAE